MGDLAGGTSSSMERLVCDEFRGLGEEGEEERVARVNQEVRLMV
jgi:hypothetical protein